MTRLLVIRLSAFGDVIHTIPAVVALREALPDADIAWAVEPAYAELVETVARVKTIPLPMKRWGRHLVAGRSEIAAARQQLRDFARGETAIDFQGLVKSALVAWNSGASLRYGFQRDAIRETAAAWFANRRIDVDRSTHVVEWNLGLARGVAPSIVAVPRVDFTPFAVDAGGKLNGMAGRVVVIPTAGRSEKQWPSNRFRELVRLIGDDVVVAWGPGEEHVAQSTGAAMAPPTNLRELAQLLRTAKVVVGGDTGPLHLAAALGAPVVGLFGPTSPARNGPYGQVHNVVESFTTTKSMQSIEVDVVMRKIAEVLSR